MKYGIFRLKLQLHRQPLTPQITAIQKIWYPVVFQLIIHSQLAIVLQVSTTTLQVTLQFI